MAGVRHVRADSSVSSVSSAAKARSTVDLDVVDEESLRVKALSISVGFSVLKEIQDKADGFLRIATLNGFVKLGFGAAADTTSVDAEGDDILLNEDIVQVDLGTFEGHSLDGAGSLGSVLVMNTKVRSGGLNPFDGVRGVSRIFLRHCSPVGR